MEDARQLSDGRRRVLGKIVFDDGETGTFWIVMKWDLRLWEVETQFDCVVVVGTLWPHDALFLLTPIFSPPLPLI